MDINSNLIIALVLAVVVCLLVLVIILALIVFKLLKTPKETNSSGPISIQVTEEDKKAVLRPAEAAGYCSFHDKEFAVSSCAICEKLLCENCDKADDTLHFCPEHFNLYLTNKWTAITNIKTTPETPEAGHHIYSFKNSNWANHQIPGYIITHYRINVESDFIESYVQLFVLEDEADELKIKLENQSKK
jgi:hypothetical protein